ncbi:MAG TPA: right-handed parallel beta-helix repeat-containing protein, partial [Candidatus Brocadiia bacterium]|nr:right-handed parallel beta-helix repeat-containing protein [Candidatus Brocadiia bacterium]
MRTQLAISQFCTMSDSLATVFVLAFALTLLSCSGSQPRDKGVKRQSGASGAGADTRMEFFVAVDGDDMNPGYEALPFATIERARDAIREKKRSSGLPPGGGVVLLRGGDHVCAKTFELTADDSGTPDAPIIWRSYGEERARILGGRVLSGFQPVADQTARARLDEIARDKVVVVDLRAHGIQDFGMIKSRGFARPTTPAHGELFFNGRPMTLAQWPNPDGWEHIKDFPKGGGVDDGHGTTMGALANGFFYDSERPERWKNTGDIWIHGYWAYDWANSYERIAELDAARRFIRTAEPYGNYGFIRNQRICFINILEELDQPGEWFLDAQTGLLYFWPPGPIDSGEVLFSLLEQPIVKLTDASHVTIQGLIFEATRGNGIEISGGAECRIAGCILRNIGNGAISITGGKNHGVTSCDIFDTGDGGVSLSGGDRETLATGGHFVENCHFQRQGRWSKCYVPAICLNGVGLRASHNLIHDHPHAAILFGGNDHLIEFNDIHHIALETGDVGAIYAGRDYTIRGNRIMYNYIHETGGVGMGSMGVYMDDCVSGTEVSGNVFYKAHWAMFIGGGRDHRVENNLFVDCDPAVRADARGLDTSPVWRNMVDQTMRERLKSVPSDLYRERYPAMKSLDAYYGPPEGPAIAGEAFKGIPPEGNVIARNICIGKWKEIAWHADEKLFDIRDNFVTEDRNQVGTPEDGFRLPTESPAWKTGFAPIPFKKIGLYQDSDRERLRFWTQTQGERPAGDGALAMKESQPSSQSQADRSALRIIAMTVTPHVIAETMRYL